MGETGGRVQSAQKATLEAVGRDGIAVSTLGFLPVLGSRALGLGCLGCLGVVVYPGRPTLGLESAAAWRDVVVVRHCGGKLS